MVVKPETVIRWHRQGFRYYWKWKSRGKPGRPPIGMEVILLIRRMSTENVLWGAPRIRSAALTLSDLNCYRKPRAPARIGIHGQFSTLSR